MNAVEIEEAVSALAAQPFDPAEFPFAFLEAFGNKATTLKRLRSGASNKSDLGGVLQTGNIHIAVCPPGEVTAMLAALRASPATARAKAKFILATDGEAFEAEDLTSAEGETVACAYPDFPDHFGFFLPLAGITTVKQVRESSFDIKATGRLNRLYVELLKDNPDWGTAARRPAMNHFMARLIFCFFAEDTDIFGGRDLFTKTVEKMSERDSSNTHEVVETLFRAMNTKATDRAGLPRWAIAFPYVNGGLFSGSMDVPHFSRIARSYLIHIGGLDWTRINPDIFGSMIQAVADDEERGALGMHYTSVPNILKVLNPLFLDDLREKLEEAGDNPRKLLNLRNRMARIRVFDPACGSGNFLVIAYKAMRAIEAEIDRRRSEAHRRTSIPLTNFRGIELKGFSAEVARLALIIAEYQCDVIHRGQKEALAEFLPLDAENWIVRGNALRLDWLSICPPTGTGVRHHAEDLFHTPLDQAQIDFENEGGETYICGNPPYVGSKRQSDLQKADLDWLLSGKISKHKILDYVSGWFVKASEFIYTQGGRAAFVATNSICQGEQVPVLWPYIFGRSVRIYSAHRSFKWRNLAANNAGVTVAVIGMSRRDDPNRLIITDGQESREVKGISPYLVPGDETVVQKLTDPASNLPAMNFGNHPYYAGPLIMTLAEAKSLVDRHPILASSLRPTYGTDEFIEGRPRYSLWFEQRPSDDMLSIDDVRARIEEVRSKRAAATKDAAAQKLVKYSYRFRDQNVAREKLFVVARHSSEVRNVLPVDLLPANAIVTDAAFAVYDGPLWTLSIIASRVHLAWIETVCGKLETRYRYSNTLGWNTFPVPTLTEKNKADLTRCAEDILLARETHFPSTIADLYEPEKMPEDLRAAHERNDEVLERIYIGRRFRNDTERLEKLFELYTKMMSGQAQTAKRGKVRA